MNYGILQVQIDNSQSANFTAPDSGLSQDGIERPVRFAGRADNALNLLQHYLFAGEQYDPALGLYYNRARYLNTTTGRFWSMDSYEGQDRDPESLHKYLYSEDNPISHTDRSGFQASMGELGTVETAGLTIDTMPTATEVGEALEGIAKATFEDEANEAAAEAAVRMIKAAGLALAVASTLVGVDELVKEQADKCHCKSAPLFHYTDFFGAIGIGLSGFMTTSRAYPPDFPAGAYATEISPSAHMSKEQLAAALYFDPQRQARAKNSWFVALCNDDKPGFEPLPTPHQWVERGEYPGVVPVSPIIIGINPMPVK